jgi:flagellar biosynthesis protein FlhB
MEEMIKKKINLQLFSDSGEKTEEATSKRKEDSRKKGQVAKSPDIAQIATLLCRNGNT